jgi:hypothetical protein
MLLVVIVWMISLLSQRPAVTHCLAAFGCTILGACSCSQ